MPDNIFVKSHPDARTDALLRETERKLHRQNQVVVDLARRPSVQTGDLVQALRDIAQAAVETLDVDRVSIWFFSEDRQAIQCREEYDRATGKHSSGGEVAVDSSPVYFHVLERERTISVHDADDEQHTAPFTETTLRSSGVRSTLDAPVRRLGRVAAVVRHTVMARRQWTVDEEHFAASIADLVALAIDAAEQRRGQQLLQHRLDFERLVSRISTRMIDLAPGEVDDAILFALKSVGRFLSTGRCCVLLVDGEGDTVSLKQEWCAAGPQASAPRVQSIPLTEFHWSADSVETMRPLSISRGGPSAAEAEQSLIVRFDAESLLAIPIAVRRDLLGVFAIASQTKSDWDDEMIALLRIVADIFASAMNRGRTEQALRDSELRYRLLADYSTDLISRIDARGKVVYASPAVTSLLGFEAAEVTGRSILDFINPADWPVVRLAVLTLARRGTLTFSFRVKRRDGTEAWFEATCRAVKSRGTGKLEEIVAVSRDISERKRVEDHIEFQAYHDDLTRLPNRILFRDRLTVALAYARRSNRPLAVLFIDLDSFKVVNDTLGHGLGDELLKTVAARLSAVIRAEDTIARMGGDEFTVLAANLSSIDDASLVAQKLLDTIAQPMTVGGHELFVTGSIGIAIHPEDGDSVESLLKNADNAMYRAKEGGRNSYKLCTPAMNRRALERLSLENALRRAIDREEFVLHFQPLIRLDSMEMTGMEALLRWNRPDHGLIEPLSFISIAEETRMIVPLGEWVLYEACRAASQWQAKHPRVRVAVNLSPRQFQHNDLKRMIVAALDASKLDPTLLELEITEGAAMHNNERTLATMRGLRELGMRLAVDDFGTGHSSLNYLHHFPIDAVKIDQGFVAGIEESASDRAIISGVITMARGLSLRVTAEGVETQPQLDFLRGCGCEEVQGFLLGKPVRIEEI